MKKTISLEMNMSELIYDIQNKTYLTGRSLSDGENHSHVAYMQANDDEENEAQILRSVTMAVSRLRSRLSEYIEANDALSNNESLKSGDTVIMSLHMPSNFNSSVTKSLGEAAHQFIVATAISDWFAITAKGETSDYNAVAEASLQVLEEALCKRSRPKRSNPE